MATVYSSTTNHWRSFLTYVVTETATTYKIEASGGFASVNWGFSLTGIDSTLSCTGMTSASGTGSVSTSTGATREVEIASVTWTFTKGTSAKSVTVACETVNDSGYMEATLTASVTLTIPALESYAVTYDANDGSGAPAAGRKYYGKTYTISTATPTRANYNFLGWSTSASATSATYEAGDSYTTNAALVLYAVWEIAYQPPTIGNLSIGRCTSSGASDDYGSYALVVFSWSCDQSAGTNKATKYTITVNGATTTVTLNATSGSVSKVVGRGALGANTMYPVEVRVFDSMGGETPASGVVPAVMFPIDFKSNGKGVSILGPAVNDGFFVDGREVYGTAVLYEGASTNGKVTLTDSAENYTYLEVFFVVGSRHTSAKVHSPNGKSVSCTIISTNESSSVCWWYVAQWAISGTSMTCTFNKTWNHGTSASSASNEVYVYRVVGYASAVESTGGGSTFYDITNSLTGCTSSNSATAIAEGGKYVATITAQDGYTLAGASYAVTMGGTDISSSYRNGTITIAEVTGDVSIIVRAVAEAVEDADVSITLAAAASLQVSSWNSAGTAASSNYVVQYDDELTLDTDGNIVFVDEKEATVRSVDVANVLIGNYILKNSNYYYIPETSEMELTSYSLYGRTNYLIHADAQQVTAVTIN